MEEPKPGLALDERAPPLHIERDGSPYIEITKEDIRSNRWSVCEMLNFNSLG